MSDMQVQPSDWSASVKTESSDIAGLGSKVALIALAGFFGWAGFVPMDSAVVAPGSVIAEGKNKQLQHRVGGRVSNILAKEGQKLKAGDPILELDTQVDQAQLSQLKARYMVFKAIKTRLEAERDNAGATDVINASPEMTGTVSDDGINLNGIVIDKGLVEAQQQEFTKGRQALKSELESLKERIASNKRQRLGLKAREALTAEQVALLRKQKISISRLVAKDHLPKQKLWEIEAQLLDRETELDRLVSEKEALGNAIAEVEATMVNVKSRDQRLSSEKLTEVLGGIEEIRDQIIAADKAVKDTVVRAPASGTLINARVTTVGGVVVPGEPFGEIVPDNSKIELLARVRPEDISYVKLGQEAEMRVSALDARVIDKVPGKVVYVAADSVVDSRTSERYFEVRGEINSDFIKQAGVTVTPGMTGEVYLKGEKRTFLAYITRPIADSIAKAFKESK